MTTEIKKAQLVISYRGKLVEVWEEDIITVPQAQQRVDELSKEHMIDHWCLTFPTGMTYQWYSMDYKHEPVRWKKVLREVAA